MVKGSRLCVTYFCVYLL